MAENVFIYPNQWNALINAINGGDTSAIATALTTIKSSIDSINTTLGSLSIDVEQDSTQWTNLINAITSGGGGGSNVTIDSTQWTDLLTSINKGDTTALATALGLIKTSIDSITTSLGSLSINVEQDSTQWTNLINAITNQSLTVDLSNITSSVVSNLSNVTGSTTTDALNSVQLRLSEAISKLDGGIYVRGTLGASVLSTVNAVSKGVTIYANSNVPIGHPTNCNYGAYIFFKGDTLCSILYMDSSHIACCYSISSTTTSITWHVA